MDTLAQLLGLEAVALTQIIILAVVLVIGWFILRVTLKLTAALFRIGCFGIALLIAAIFVLQLIR